MISMNNTPAAHECSEELLAIRDTFETLGGKWKLQILHYLSARVHEVNTFKKIEHGIAGISAKMLAKELKVLEANGLVTREVQPTKPITVQYNITDYGKTSEEIINQLVCWGRQHREKIRREMHYK
jgi:DNA-binding HxlR family transcriptional regulator